MDNEPTKLISLAHSKQHHPPYMCTLQRGHVHIKMASAGPVVHYQLTNGKAFESEPRTKSRFADKPYRKPDSIQLTFYRVNNNNEIITDIMIRI